MAKLLATLSLVVWLVLVLTVIVRSAPSSDENQVRKRNDDDWKRLGNACVVTLGNEGRDEPRLEEFLSNLKKVSKQNDCSDRIRNDIVYHLKTAKDLVKNNEKFAETFKLMKDYFFLYLDECGFEESFKKVAEIMKNKSLEKFTFYQHETLKSYIDVVFLERFFRTPKLQSLLQDISDISKLEQMSVETDCTQELQGRYTRSFAINSEHINTPSKEDERVREFQKSKFAFYLDKCGYEELYSNRNLNSEEYPTLYNYFVAILPANESKQDLPEWLTKILSMMRQSSTLESISTETLCTGKLDDTLSADLKFTSGEAQHLYQLYGDYLKVYLRSCGFEDQYEKMFGNVQHISNEPTLYEYLREKTLTGNELAWILKVIGQLSASKEMEIEDDCDMNRLENFEKWLGETSDHPEWHSLFEKYDAFYKTKCGVAYKPSFGDK